MKKEDVLELVYPILESLSSKSPSLLASFLVEQNKTISLSHAYGLKLTHSLLSNIPEFKILKHHNRQLW